MSDDILQHNNGVVHHKADHQNEGHERKVVQAEARRKHERISRHDGERHGETGDDGGHGVVQKEVDNGNNQKNGQNEGKLHFIHGILNGDGAVFHDFHVDGGRQGFLNGGQNIQNVAHHLYCIAAGLARHLYDDAVLSIDPAGLFGVLHAFFHQSDIFQTHRRAVAPGHDDFGKFLCRAHFSGCFDIADARLPFQRAGGQGDVGVLHRA